jgi:predicted dehydrogenase
LASSASISNRTGVALIGLGYWGPKLLKALLASPRAELLAVCDRHPEHLEEIKVQVNSQHPGSSAKTLLAGNPEDVFKNPDVKLIFIATQAQSHFTLVERALKAGKAVMVEKPCTTSLEQALQLQALAQQTGGRVFVDHIYLFSNELRRFQHAARTLFQAPQFLYKSERSDFGPFANDVGIAPLLLYHDLYVVDELWDLARIESAHSQQRQVISPWKNDHVHLEMQTANPQQAFALEASLLSPQKVRRISLHTSEGVLLWDDLLAPEQKIRFYRKQIQVDGKRAKVIDKGVEEIKDLGVLLWPESEPLRNLVEHTIESFQSGKPAIHEIEKSIRIWRVIDAIEKKNLLSSQETPAWRL